MIANRKMSNINNSTENDSQKFAEKMAMYQSKFDYYNEAVKQFKELKDGYEAKVRSNEYGPMMRELLQKSVNICTAHYVDNMIQVGFDDKTLEEFKADVDKILDNLQTKLKQL